MLLLALVGCTPVDSLPDPGFVIVGVSPDEDAADVVEAHIPELRFSDPIDPALCTPETLRLDAVHADESVAFAVALAVVSKDEGYRVQLTHDAPLPTGWTYRLSARGGDDGCQSLDGLPLAPFASAFTVVE